MTIESPAADTREYLLRCRAALMTQPTPANLAKVAAFDIVLRYVEVGVRIEAETTAHIRRTVQAA